MVSVVRPRKSNLTRPIASTSSLSNWLTAASVPWAQYNGQKSVRRPGAISTPPACIPTLRVRPSSGRASSTISPASSSAATASAKAGSSRNARSSVHGSVGLCGISLDSRSHFEYGKSSTRPTSRTTAFAPSVPNVAICATACAPYLCLTYSITRSLPSWQKSMSKSGIDTRSGFRNRSNSRSYCNGSRSVMPSAYATRDPAPEPRPGPTGTPLSLAQLMKSATIRKYPENPILAMVDSSCSRRARYCGRRRSRSAASGNRRSRRRCSPARDRSWQNWSSETPAGVGKSGRRGRPSGKQLGHLGLGLEVLLLREAARAARIGQREALGDADPGLVRPKIAGCDELHRVGGHHRKPQLARQHQCGPTITVVAVAPGPLQLQVKAPRKQVRQAPRGRLGREFLTGAQQHTDLTRRPARQRDQPGRKRGRGRLAQPVDPYLTTVPMPVLEPGARQQLAQVQVPAAILDQQQQAKRAVAVDLVTHPHIAAEDRLDPTPASGRVKANRAEQVAQIGQGQRALLVGGRRVHGLVDAHQAIDHRELRVQAQMDERVAHAGHSIEAADQR